MVVVDPVIWKAPAGQRVIGALLAILAAFLLLASALSLTTGSSVARSVVELVFALALAVAAVQILGSRAQVDAGGITYRAAFRTRRFTVAEIADVVVASPGQTGAEPLMRTLVVQRVGAKPVPLRVLSAYRGSRRATLLPQLCQQAREALGLITPA